MRRTLSILAALGAGLGAAAGMAQIGLLRFGAIGADQRLLFWGFFVAAGILLAGLGAAAGGLVAAAARRGRRALPVSVGAALPAAFFSVFVPANVRDLPHVFLLVTDTTRADHLSLYGYERRTTSSLEELAGRSVVFTNAVSQGSHTIVSTPCILASTYPSDHGVIDYRSVLADRFRLVSEILKDDGYATFGIVTNPHLSESNGFAQGFDRYALIGSGTSRAVLAERVNREALAVVDSLLAARPEGGDSTAVAGSPPTPAPGSLLDAGDGSRPPAAASSPLDAGPAWPLSRPAGPDGAPARIFGFLFYTDPHAPYESPREYRRLYDPDWEGEDFVFAWDPKVQGDPDDRSLVNLVAQYDAAITYWDAQLGVLLTELDRRGLLENSLLVYTSDHGEEFYEHGEYGHGHSLFEESVHVPLVISLPVPIRFPRLTRTSRIVDEVVSSVDVLPTLLDYLGIPVPEDARGRSALALAVGGSAGAGERTAYLEEILEKYGSYDLRALRTRTRKCIMFLNFRGMVREREDLFFDLEADPGETTNLLDERPDEAARLLDLLTDRIHDAALTGMERAEKTNLDESHIEQLRALGYIE